MVYEYEEFYKMIKEKCQYCDVYVLDDLDILVKMPYGTRDWFYNEIRNSVDVVLGFDEVLVERLLYLGMTEGGELVYVSRDNKIYTVFEDEAHRTDIRKIIELIRDNPIAYEYLPKPLRKELPEDLKNAAAIICETTKPFVSIINPYNGKVLRVVSTKGMREVEDLYFNFNDASFYRGGRRLGSCLNFY